MDAPHTQKFIKLFREILVENESLSVFLNNVTIGNISSNGSYIPHSKIRFFKDVEHTAAVPIPRSDNFSSIRISEFSIRDISARSIYEDSSYSSDETSKYFYQNLYNKYWSERYVASKIGINVCRKAKIKGYILNFSDVKKLIHETLSKGSYDRIIDYINEFYYIGDRNCLLGVSSVNGLLYIRQQTIVKLIDNNEIDIVKRCIKNMLVSFYQLYDKFCNLNMRTYKEEIVEIITEMALHRIVNGDRVGRRYYRVYNEQESPEEFMKTIKSYVTDSVKDAVSGTVFGIKDVYSYAQIINTIMGQRKKLEDQVFKEGFAKGMQIGLKIEMLGWRTSHCEFAECEKSSTWWEKEVKIIPDSFIHGGQKYLIPEKERCYKITMLYINQDGTMMAKGTHPNISGSRVCMGDLKINLADALSDIQESLRRAEELLDMINYDSAYHRDKMEHLITVSTKTEMFNTDEVKRRKKIAQIRELGSGDFNEDEDEEEIVEKPIKKVTENIVQIKSKNNIVAELIKTNLSGQVKNSILQNSKADYNVENKELESIHNEMPPVYITDDTPVATELNYVQGDGNRRPVVFVNDGNMEVQTSVQASTSSEQLTLGDANLI
jgi:6-pyruvoyl-tetrahydropterin synthase